MNNKSRHLNLIPATAIALAGTLVSQIEKATWGSGLRFWITVSGVTAGGGTDSIYLAGVPPNGSALVPLIGFTAVNMLSVAGTYAVDFICGEWLPVTGLATGGKLLGVAAIVPSMQWGVQVTMGAGNAATITVDAEMMP